MEVVEHNEDGRPLVQIFYDEIWAVIKKFEELFTNLFFFKS